MSAELIFSFIKEKSPRMFMVVLVCSCFLLFGPENIIRKLGVDQFIDEYRALIGAGGLFSFAFLLVYGASELFLGGFKKLKGQKALKALKAKQAEYMDNLSGEEVLYLLPFWSGVNTLNFRLEDGVRGGLEGKGIIYQASSVGSILDGFAYNIQPWALEYLKQNPIVFEKHVGEISDQDDFNKIYKNGQPWNRSRW